MSCYGRTVTADQAWDTLDELRSRLFGDDEAPEYMDELNSNPLLLADRLRDLADTTEAGR